MKAPAASDSRAALPKPTDRLVLGAGLRVSPICVGLVRSPEAIPAAFDAGINFFFFTSDMHWVAYEPTRRGLEMLCSRDSGVRDQIVVAVVCYLSQPEFCNVPFRDVMRELPWLGRIDVAVAGGVYGYEFPYRLPVYRAHRAQAFLGVRAIGASFHDRGAAVAAIREQSLDIAFVRYNPDHPGARADLFPAMASRATPLVYNFNSTYGFLGTREWSALGLPPETWRPTITDYYRFALTRPQVHGLLCSLRDEGQVESLRAALEQGPLTPDEEEHLLEVARLHSGS